MFVRWLLPFFAADDGGGNSGSDDDQGGKIKPSDVLARYGQTAESALRMAEKLAESENVNWELREKNRGLREERNALKGKAAPDGAIILTADDAKQWEAYRALGKPEELGKAVTERDTAQQELGKLQRAETIRTAAEAHGYKAGPLGKLPSLAGKDLLSKDAQDAEGKPIKQWFVKDGTAETALPDYIQQHDPEFLGALAAETQPIQSGTSYVQQSAGGGKPKPQNAGQAYVQNTKYAVPGKTT